MQVTPKKEEELKKPFDLLPDNSEYDFEVLNAIDKVSKSGNDMIEINIGIYTSDKIGPRIFDYLLDAMEAKLRHFCDTTGLLREYENGTLNAEMCRGRAGKCRIGIKKDKTGQYPDKNVIKDYVCRPAKPLRSNYSDIPEEETELEPF